MHVNCNRVVRGVHAPAGMLVLLLFLAGCATPVPEPLRDVAATAPTLPDVLNAPGEYVGAEVRWGGIIVDVRTEAAATWVEMVGRELDAQGRPVARDWSDGRFLIRFDRFVEPTVYSVGRELTVVGRLVAPVEGTIGDYLYRYPVIRAERSWLWPERRPVEPAFRDPWRGPWLYDPWYPYPFSPWYRPYYW